MSKQLPMTGPRLDSQEIILKVQKALSSEEIQSALRTSVAILRGGSGHYDWVGVYLVEGEMLELAAWDGESETEHVRIPIGRGICGSAVKEGHTIVVPDVNKDPRYLACFASTRSEIVVPILGKNSVLGEIDIDSDRPSAFDSEDQMTLETIARMLADALESK